MVTVQDRAPGVCRQGPGLQCPSQQHPGSIPKLWQATEHPGCNLRKRWQSPYRAAWGTRCHPLTGHSEDEETALAVAFLFPRPCHAFLNAREATSVQRFLFAAGSGSVRAPWAAVGVSPHVLVPGVSWAHQHSSTKASSSMRPWACVLVPSHREEGKWPMLTIKEVGTF